MGRVLAIDPGEKHFGFAISDETKTISSPFLSKEFFYLQDVIKFLKDLTKKYVIDVVVIGVPERLDKKKRVSHIKNISFALGDMIQKELNIKVEYENEILTTKEAIRYIGRKDKRSHKVSASIILESYLQKIRDDKKE